MNGKNYTTFRVSLNKNLVLINLAWNYYYGYCIKYSQN